MEVLLAIPFPIAFVYILIMWVRNLKFYRSNGWDFSQDSRLGVMNWGYYGTSGKMPNRAALFFGYPFALAGFGFASYELIKALF